MSCFSFLDPVVFSTLRRGGQDVVPDELRVGLHVARMQHGQGKVHLRSQREDSVGAFGGYEL